LHPYCNNDGHFSQKEEVIAEKKQKCTMKINW
jgi:hypothetical protein